MQAVTFDARRGLFFVDAGPRPTDAELIARVKSLGYGAAIERTVEDRPPGVGGH